MTFRPPQSLRRFDLTSNGVNVLEYELMAERADALGHHGLKVEKAIAALNGFDHDRHGQSERERLLDEAADAVWAFFIQREICGLRDARDAVHRYGIPKEVMARLGVVRKR
ncbi:hypothetical protein GOL30_27345 [Sinorhizobium medicae]|uniref:Uncharacterized protein n=2 Tax=Sinorhizobium medicae TaxID=110321 RepID=A0A6G1WLB3_9HYPH|nr:DUF6665 family protein [Sinorhizobium medicae]ABR62278.1 conserved hypothetical protein [Sinorhizobium medicae WSM419]MBO1940843.1 hypothetical protein [Sinorhizobium medicae]MBO1964090.1 hypothetical protein [Sinorhizobium medicae]MDX0405839.1 hypothetical protein [Sinorhizobium medicae]MDX0411400.1 hypothetical protein [Sinorhizobium medicae]